MRFVLDDKLLAHRMVIPPGIGRLSDVIPAALSYRDVQTRPAR